MKYINLLANTYELNCLFPTAKIKSYKVIENYLISKIILEVNNETFELTHYIENLFDTLSNLENVLNINSLYISPIDDLTIVCDRKLWSEFYFPLMKTNKIEFNKLEQRLERQPSFNEMLSECNSGFSEDELDFYFASLNNHMSSLDKQIGNEGSTATMVDLMKDDESLEPSSYLDDSDREYRQNSLLNLLDTELEKEVINLLFGLDGQTPLALKTIGFLMGLTSERVRQIRDISIRKLKVSLTK